MRNPAIWAVLILLVIVLFGARRLPEAAKSIGQSIKAFKGEMQPDETADNKSTSPEDPNKP